MNRIPCVLLFLPRKKADPILIVHKADAPGPIGSVAWGKIMRIDSPDFLENCATYLKESLESYPTRKDAGPAEFDLLSDAEQKKIDRNYLDLLASQQPNGELWISGVGSSKPLIFKGEIKSPLLARKLFSLL